MSALMSDEWRPLQGGQVWIKGYVDVCIRNTEGRVNLPNACSKH